MTTQGLVDDRYQQKEVAEFQPVVRRVGRTKTKAENDRGKRRVSTMPGLLIESTVGMKMIAAG